MKRQFRVWTFIMDVTSEDVTEWKSLNKVQDMLDSDTLQLDSLAHAGHIKGYVEDYIKEEDEKI